MKQKKAEMNPVLQDDILRYKKNKLAANIVLLALVFNCLYFMLFYSVNNVNYYTYLLGFSVIVNLFVLLAGFFCSEAIKGYNAKFAFVLFGLAAVQVIRIFIFPLKGIKNDWLTGNYYFGVEMKSPVQGVILIIFLAASAACFILSGIHGFITANRLKAFQKKLDGGELSVEKTLKELDERDAAKIATAAQDEQEIVKAETNVQDVQADSEDKSTETEETVETVEKTLSSEEADNG